MIELDSHVVLQQSCQSLKAVRRDCAHLASGAGLLTLLVADLAAVLDAAVHRGERPCSPGSNACDSLHSSTEGRGDFLEREPAGR